MLKKCEQSTRTYLKMYKIEWTPSALRDYYENIDYLYEHWTQKEAIHFTRKLNEYLSIISKKPKTFSATTYKKVRKVPIVKQVTLYYRIHQSHIQILRLWNNFKNPSNLNL